MNGPGRSARDEVMVRALLLFYPRWFRRARGADLAQSYRDTLADARREGRSRTHLWTWLALDAAATGMKARFSRHGRRADVLASDGRGWEMGGIGIYREFRLALRSLARTPLFTGLAVVLMGLGIGANTAIFGAVYSALLRPLPYANPDRLVWLMNRYLPGGSTGAMAKAELAGYRAGQPSLDAIAGLSPTAANLTGIQVPVRVEGWAVSPGYFQLLGIVPELGRAFSPDEERPGRSPVVILSHGLWQRAFGGDPSIVGRSVTLDDRGFKVVGVMPARPPSLGSLVSPGHGSDYWEPLVMDPSTFDAQSLQVHNVFALGRLSDGSDADAAGRDLTRALHQVVRTYGGDDDGTGQDVVALPLRARVAGEARPVLLLLMAAVGLVLVLTCVNVTSLLVARGDARTGELAIRAAMGASRPQLLVYVLGEAVAIGLGGGLVGLAIPRILHSALPSLLASGLPNVVVPGLDLPVLGFTLLLSLAAGLVAGVVPAFRIVKGDILGGLRSGDRGAVRAGRRILWRGLVVLQVGGAVTFVAGGTLLTRSLVALRSVDPGYDPTNLLMVEVNASQPVYNSPERVRELYQELETRVRALPGVESAATSWQTPLQSGMSDWPLTAEGSEKADWVSADPNLVSPSYFETLGIRVEDGRLFDASDPDRSDGVVVLNETAARRLWPDGKAVGRRVNFNFGTPSWREVIGVVADVKGRGLGAETRPEWYVTFGPGPFARLARLTLSVRTNMSAERLRSSLVGILAGIDPNIPVGSVTSMEERISGTLSVERSLTALLSAFGAMALALGAIGVFGLMAYTVQMRRREIGLRMAIGAGRGSVVGMVVREALALGCLGVLGGLVGSVVLGRLLADFLFGVGPTDPGTLGFVAAVVLATITVSALFPAARAGSMDPLRALSSE